MIQTIAAIVDARGAVRLLEPVQLARNHRALVTILADEPSDSHEMALLSEASLAEDWNRPEEDAKAKVPATMPRPAKGAKPWELEPADWDFSNVPPEELRVRNRNGRANLRVNPNITARTEPRPPSPYPRPVETEVLLPYPRSIPTISPARFSTTTGTRTGMEAITPKYRRRIDHGLHRYHG